MLRHRMTPNFKDSLRTNKEISRTSIAQQLLEINLLPTREEMLRPSPKHCPPHRGHCPESAAESPTGKIPLRRKLGHRGDGRPPKRGHPARPAGRVRARGAPGEAIHARSSPRESGDGPSQATTARRHPPPSPCRTFSQRHSATSATARPHAHSDGGAVTRQADAHLLWAHCGDVVPISRGTLGTVGRRPVHRGCCRPQ